MIRISSSREIRSLLRSTLAMPADFERVILCSPFIDEETFRDLVSLSESTTRAQCGFRVVTRAEIADKLLLGLPSQRSPLADAIVRVPALHAKCFLALSRDVRRTRAIVTSANLTVPGLWSNIEIGVVAAPTSDAGRQLVSEVREFLERLLDIPRRSLSIFNPRRAA